MPLSVIYASTSGLIDQPIIINRSAEGIVQRKRKSMSDRRGKRRVAITDAAKQYRHRRSGELLMLIKTERHGPTLHSSSGCDSSLCLSLSITQQTLDTCDLICPRPCSDTTTSRRRPLSLGQSLPGPIILLGHFTHRLGDYNYGDMVPRACRTVKRMVRSCEVNNLKDECGNIAHYLMLKAPMLRLSILSACHLL